MEKKKLGQAHHTPMETKLVSITVAPVLFALLLALGCSKRSPDASQDQSASARSSSAADVRAASERPPSPTPSVSLQESKSEPWRTSLPAFVEKLGDVLSKAKVPEWNGQYGLRDAKGDPVFWFNHDSPEGTWQGDVNRTFSGKQIEWDVTVKSVSQDKGMRLVFKTEDISTIATSKALIDDIAYFGAVMKDPGSTKIPAANQRLRIHGQLRAPSEENPMGGILTMVGAGPAKGKRQIHITVYDCTLRDHE